MFYSPTVVNRISLNRPSVNNRRSHDGFIVFDHHPIWERAGIQRLVIAFLSQPMTVMWSRLLFGEALSSGISWRCSIRTMLQALETRTDPRKGVEVGRVEGS